MNRISPGKLVLGIIARNDPDLLARAEAVLGRDFATVELRSATIPFDFTDYYEKEMGQGLVRCWLGCQGTVARESLIHWKLRAKELESAFADEKGRRRINLDPGILTLSNLILASTKDFAHRIYLGSGIYAELTLIYRSGRFQPLDWTYPDYRTPACLEFLAACRERLASSLRQSLDFGQGIG